MRSGLLLFFFLISTKIFAQAQFVEGIIFDADNKGRIAIVNIVNTTKGTSVYNNLSGVFSMEADVGDVLIFSKIDYVADTVRLTDLKPLAIYLHRTSIQLREVTIRDSLYSPQARLAVNKALYNSAYSTTNNADLLSLGRMGVGFSIDALYNIFSNKARDVQRLQNAIERDYKQDQIDFRFTKSFVGRITGLKNAQLEDFMTKYRPGYYFLTYASDYEFITSIRANLKRYFRNPDAYALTPLNSSKTK